ncbi:hypothetical protein LC087_12535 [Bacillus carboniphilus]|uniref:Lipoprotein n=1 Tax=Bacillus carboniphilus TaxID=86663 RepID=A0ABY9JTR6_9BACI|nr:hypothetical protein [Bacillus carboniphilus]WLR41688.1 hypothetical protein LC087_12535 [Bacillus carboniphilus]
MRSILLFMINVCMAVYLSGCNNVGQDEQSQNGMNIKSLERNATYNGDPNPNVNITHNHLHTGDDQKQLENAVKDEPIVLKSVWFNGKDAYVTISSESDLTSEESQTLVQRIKEKMQNALPRFDIHLKMAKSE